MDEDLQNVIVTLLKFRTGVELRCSDEDGARLSLMELSGGIYQVLYQPMTDQTLDSKKYPPQQFRYDNPETAVARFLAFRRSLRLGFDFEDPVRHYNPGFGDHKPCSCGHSYIRHFDIDNGCAVTCRCGCQGFDPK